jgi:lipopolysaccharide/colanic/teichoic acid biosynthesis glycosyltransferase
MLPFVPFIVYCIKKTSGGSVFYLQERVGKNGIPFKMLKFRSMFMDAEKDGPALSSGNDKRITKTGRWLRRWRLDEVPQLLNVLAGHMSLVGPRPEREHYLQKILEEAPYYSLVLKVKPGITSLGMVKFGYAENIDEMIRRARYDVLYIENQSLLLDVKIMFYTLGTLLKGEGK